MNMVSVTFFFTSLAVKNLFFYFAGKANRNEYISRMAQTRLKLSQLFNLIDLVVGFRFVDYVRFAYITTHFLKSMDEIAQKID